MTTKQELSGNWDTIASAVRQKYAQITDSDLKQAEGNLNELADVIRKKTGESRMQVEDFFDDCCESADSIMKRTTELAGSAGESIREGFDQATEQARRGYDTTVNTMSQHPLASIGVGIGVGLAMGLVLGISIGAQRERQLSWRERWSR